MSDVLYRSIDGFPGYRVGDDGSIWSCWKKNGRGRPYVLSADWRRLKPDVRRFGHQYITLSRQGATVRRQVHQIVLEAFVGPAPDGLEGCHDDGNASNNALGNLRWDTHQANMLDRSRHGRCVREGHGRAKMTEETVRELRELRTYGVTTTALAARFRIGVTQVRRILSGEHWRPEVAL